MTGHSHDWKEISRKDDTVSRFFETEKTTTISRKYICHCGAEKYDHSKVTILEDGYYRKD